MIPTLSIRAGKGKQQPSANNKQLASKPAALPPKKDQKQEPSSSSTPTGAQQLQSKPPQQQKAEALKTNVAQQKSVIQKKSVVIRPPVFDAQCHLLSCLSIFSHRLAVRAHDLKSIANAEKVKNQFNLVTDILVTSDHGEEEKVDSKKSKTGATSGKKMNLQRSKQAFRLSQQIGQKVIRTSLFRSNEKKRKAKRKTNKTKKATVDNNNNRQKKKDGKSSQEQQQPTKTIAVTSTMMTISGAAKRARAVKHKKAKRQLKEIDRRQLKKYFCLSCGRPKILGCGFETVYRRGKTKSENSKIDDKKKKLPMIRRGLRCIKCSHAMRAQERKKKNPLLALAALRSKKVPKAVLLKRLRKKKKQVRSSNHLRIRGNKNVAVTSFPLRPEHSIKFWKSALTSSKKIQIQRVKDRKKNVK